MTEPETRTVWLRNDTGSDYKWPTLGIGNHAAGETLAIQLWTTDAVPFGFTEVDGPPQEAAAAPVNPTPSTPGKRSRDTEPASTPAPTPPAEPEAT